MAPIQMEDQKYEEVGKLLEDLAGQAPTLSWDHLHLEQLSRFLDGTTGIGYSQLNELLLLLGFDRVSKSFFQWLVDETIEYKSGASIGSLGQLSRSVERFQKFAILLFGNVKFGFKRLSRDSEALEFWIESTCPIPEADFTQRHSAVLSTEDIEGSETYYLGYLIEEDIKDRLSENPGDPEAIKQENTRLRIVEKGKGNHDAYLASDHLDVYVATSMRERHQYLMVNDLVGEIFNSPDLAHLKLRYFDPTQAYCQKRIDKGLSEALMLKRAKCTLYFVQESDTLGKDSELAATLAQGKTVIAFVPHGDGTYVDDLLTRMATVYTDQSQEDLVLGQLQVFTPKAAWEDDQVRGWLSDRDSMDIEVGKEKLAAAVFKHYEKRANTLKDSHPLGIQVNLATGVANGLLVARDVSQCTELLKRAVTRTLEFDLERESVDGKEYLNLREKTTNCIYRVVTGDAMLTNTFWNFYL